MGAPYLAGAYVVEERLVGASGFPLTLPFVRALELKLPSAVTVFVGENGSGKSTLLEVLAELVGLPWDGGSRNELSSSEHTSHRRLAEFLRPQLRRKPPNKYFFRSEALSDLARLLEAREGAFDSHPLTRRRGRCVARLEKWWRVVSAR